jgi:hypothetical protein
MPRTKTGLLYPKKGSQAAYEWAEKMRKAKAKKKKQKLHR